MDGSRNGWRGKKNLGRKIISFDLWRIPNLHNFILTIVKIAFRESFYFLLNGRFVLNDERDEIRVLSILITITEKETGRYVDSNEVKKEKGEGEEGEEGRWTRRNVEKEKSTISLRPNCPAYFRSSFGSRRFHHDNGRAAKRIFTRKRSHEITISALLIPRVTRANNTYFFPFYLSSVSDWTSPFRFHGCK